MHVSALELAALKRQLACIAGKWDGHCAIQWYDLLNEVPIHVRGEKVEEEGRYWGQKLKTGRSTVHRKTHDSFTLSTILHSIDRRPVSIYRRARI